METPVSPLEKGIAKIVPDNGLKEKLLLSEREGKPLTVKLGFDPTAPDLHLGHAVVLRKLREFQEAGHRVVVIIGDFTAQIGDPTGKNKSRPPLETAQIKANAETYLDQLSKIIDLSKVDIRHNSEWFNPMVLTDVIRLISRLTVAQIMERNDFKSRYQAGTPIAMHELIYPILQGYDSMMIDADVELGGTDQLFNIMVGRYIQESRERVQQVAVCMPLLKGRDGTEKMSKSQGNHIGLLDLPNDMYGKVMSVPDSAVLEYLDLATNLSIAEKERKRSELAGGQNPMITKKSIAHNIVTIYHDSNQADTAQGFFELQVQSKSFDDKEFIPIMLSSLGIENSNVSLIDLCGRLEKARSKGDIRRMILAGAVTVNGQKIVDITHVFAQISDKMRIKIGKRGYYELSI